jgi:pyruvate dehydrogenase E2 component (dihydrolipoamide acetyltransferase)
MATDLTLPALSPTMEKGTLAKWLVKPGDTVKPGDQIAEIETDKATMEMEAADEGRIVSILVAQGTADVPVGTAIASIAEGGKASAGPVPEGAVAATAGPVDAAPLLAGPEPARLAPALEAAPPQTCLSPAERIKASPLALRIAEAKGIDLAGMSGTGANGRIVRADLGIGPLVAPRHDPVPQAALAATAAFVPPPPGVPVETVRLGAMRRTIARRLTHSKQAVPHFYLTARCKLDPLLKLRGELNSGLTSRSIKVSVNDMLIKAMAIALAEVPDANVQFGGEELHRFGRVDISMAVAIDGGLLTPVIRGADTLSVSAIAVQTRALAAKARDGKLTPEDYQGGTASISNLGMFGIDEMVPVINPPQALILGVGAGVEQPWKVGGEIGLATIVALTASFDHRAIDGAVAAQFMKALRDLVESPVPIVG